MNTVLLAFGTRPEAIKLAPVYQELTRGERGLRCVCCVTGQHREILAPVLQVFGMRPDFDLEILTANQTLFDVTTRALSGMQEVLEEVKPDLVVVQGDTTSAFAAALAAFYMKIPVAHVEAGLRSFDRFQPFPEEMNRSMITRVADLNFCPTENAAQNLRNEAVPEESIHVTGNTVIDALLQAVQKLSDQSEAAGYVKALDLPEGPMILVTGHRRENFGRGLANLCLALHDLLEAQPNLAVVYSVHPNPNARKPVEEILGSHPRARIIPPPDYFRFVALMKDSFFIITDSGGIQEEAPSLKKPVLVARNVSERSEAVEAGTAILVGTDRTRIVEESKRLLLDRDHYTAMTARKNPFGDGRSAERIVKIIEEFLSAGGTGSIRRDV